MQDARQRAWLNSAVTITNHDRLVRFGAHIKGTIVLENSRVYSIWLKPTGPVQAELAEIINRLSRQQGTPSFEPHVTLIGELTGTEEQLIQRSQELAEQLHPFTVQLAQVGYLDAYFRSIFVHVEETEPVMQANAQARKLFQRTDDDKYMPHLSLLYGNLTPAAKQEIIRSIGETFRQSFPVNTIYLVMTQGEPKDWYLLGEFAL